MSSGGRRSILCLVIVGLFAFSGCGGSEESTDDPGGDASRTLSKKDARAAIENFYDQIDRGYFTSAWRSLSASAKSGLGSLTSWSSGHESRDVTDLRDIWVEPLSDQSALAHIDLRTVDGSDCGLRYVQYFTGTWKIFERDSELLLSEPNIEFVRGDDPEAAGAECEKLRLARQEARQRARERRLAALEQQESYSGYYGSDYDNDYEIDSTPEKLDGSSSYEFEADDIARAEDASPEVQEYCSGAVSEAQYVGCLSHVDEWDIP